MNKLLYSNLEGFEPSYIKQNLSFYCHTGKELPKITISTYAKNVSVMVQWLGGGGMHLSMGLEHVQEVGFVNALSDYQTRYSHELNTFEMALFDSLSDQCTWIEKLPF